jgi:hypothetical protein
VISKTDRAELAINVAENARTRTCMLDSWIRWGLTNQRGRRDFAILARGHRGCERFFAFVAVGGMERNAGERRECRSDIGR